MASGAGPAADSELQALIELLLEGRLDELARTRLNQRLGESRAARRAFSECVALHGLLQWHGAGRAPLSLFELERAVQDDVAAAAPPPRVRRDAEEPPVATLPNFVRRGITYLSAPARFGVFFAAVSVIALTLFFAQIRVETPTSEPGHQAKASPALSEESAARITGSLQCEWESEPPPPRATIHAGRPLAIQSGLLELTLKNGVTLVVEGPARLTIDDPQRATLRHGKLVARVPAQAVGFVLDTAAARITDLGTEFGVHVDAEVGVEAYVFRGAVEVELQSPQPASPGSARQKLVAGQAIRVRHSGAEGVMELLSDTSASYVRQIPASQVKPQAHSPSRYAGEQVLPTKPVAYWDFSRRQNWFLAFQDRLRNRGFDAVEPQKVGVPGPILELDANDAAVDNWAVIPGPKGLTSRQMAEMAVPTNSYSIALWVNSTVAFETLPLHYIFSRGNENSGVQELRDAVLVVGPYQPRLATHVGRLAFADSSGPACKDAFGKTPLQPHQWYWIVLVRDEDQIRVYLDGQLEIAGEFPWLGGGGSWATFGGRPDLDGRFGWNGPLDEIAIWNRALTSEEVAAMHSAAQAETHSK